MTPGMLLGAVVVVVATVAVAVAFVPVAAPAVVFPAEKSMEGLMICWRRRCLSMIFPPAAINTLDDSFALLLSPAVMVVAKELLSETSSVIRTACEVVAEYSSPRTLPVCFSLGSQSTALGEGDVAALTSLLMV